MERNPKISRRNLLKLGAAAGAAASVGAGLVPSLARAQDEDEGGSVELPQVPRRTLGKTGETVPILLFGAGVKLDSRFDPKLAEAYRFGVNYIDAADCYGGGTCETSVGNFLARAELRDKIWVTSKSDAHDPEGLEKTLTAGLESMRTDYFNMYFLHAVEDPSPLKDPELRKTVERLKKEGRIRHFGFSCHDGNVAELLHLAGEVGWVDAVMFRYNFRQYGNTELNKAMDAARAADVGLIAMKTQGSEVSFEEKWKPFEQTGKWNKHQAVLKAVWADERISAAVSAMKTFDILKENIAAALDRHDMGQADYQALEEYAAATRGAACDGCDHLCNPAVDAPVRIGATLRYLMYHDTYGDTETARQLFSQLPEGARRLREVDFRPANAACPHGVDVVSYMARASEVFEA